MKFASTMLLLGVASAATVQTSSRSLLQTSLVMLEAPIKAPKADQVLVNTDSDEQRFKKNNKKTTLTIVQDFPKKPTEPIAAASAQLVQGKLTDIKMAAPDENRRTTLTIVQDFQKKQADPSETGAEMV
jgi:hypothetical protein